MSKRKQPKWRSATILIALMMVAAWPAVSQEILLDRRERCGEMLCYQSLDDPLVYYYLPDSPRLATRNGKPQFSFLKYARTQETGEAGITRAEGGGIVHFLVTYGADEARVQAAAQGLQEKVPGARIAGPIVYRKGSFALVTSFTEENEAVTRTVAVGKAPLMEGQKAAVSMALTREGAELLWESFQSATPDISLVFDMEFAGVREPYEATLEADWSRVSKHKRVQAGAKYKWFGVDVDLLFQELRQDGAVKITTRGENATLDKILESANAKLLQVMFDPAPTGELARMAADKGYGSLNQAVKMLKAGKPATKTKAKKAAWAPVFGTRRLARVTSALARDASSGWRTGSSTGRVSPAALPLSPHPSQSPEQDPRYKQALETFQRAREMMTQGKNESAIPLFKEANALYKQATGRDSWGATNNIGVCLYRLEKSAESLPYFQSALDLANTDERKRMPLYYQALVLHDLRRYSEAVQFHQRAAQITGEQPSAEDLFTAYGMSLYELSRYEEALAKYDEALKTEGEDQAKYKLYFYSAVCLDYLGRYEEARARWLKAAAVVEGQDELQEVFHLLAKSREKAERYAESAEYFGESAKLMADGSDARSKEEAKAQELSVKAHNQARRLDDEARQASFEVSATRKAYQAYVAYRDHVLPEGTRAAEVKGRIDFLSAKLQQAGGAAKAPTETPTPGAEAPSKTPAKPAEEGAPAAGKPGAATTPAPGKDEATHEEAQKQAALDIGRDLAAAAKGAATPSKPNSTISSKTKSTKASPATKRRKDGAPGFSLVASFQMKRIKTSGHLVFEMNHMRNEMQASAMTANLGDLYRRWGSDPQVFRAVNIDDPVFKQREILVTLDGQDQATFAEHVNFVSVQLEKRHQSGQVTTDEVVISPERFEADGNAFFLRYGWKGDDDRERWLGYTVKTVWSFHGGMEVRADWQANDTPMLALAPPHRYRAVTVEGEGERLTAAGVRHGVVRVTSRVAGREVVREATIRNRGPVPSAVLAVAEDPDGPETTYEITWYLEGARTVSAPPKPLAGDLVYWDELPEEGTDVGL